MKTIQEVITLVVFCFFSIFYLKEALLITKHIVEPDPEREEIEKRLIILDKSSSFAQAAGNMRSLMEFEKKLTKSDVLRVVETVKSNNQVSGSFDAQPYYKRLFTKNAHLLDVETLKQVL